MIGCKLSVGELGRNDMTQRKMEVPEGICLGNQIIDGQWQHLNRLADTSGTKQAKTAALDYLIASMIWLAEVEGVRPTYELICVCADRLLDQTLNEAR